MIDEPFNGFEETVETVKMRSPLSFTWLKPGSRFQNTTLTRRCWCSLKNVLILSVLQPSSDGLPEGFIDQRF